MSVRKILAGWVAAALLVGLMPGSMAAGAPGLTITSGEARAGEAVTLTVGVENNPGVAACLLYLYYDTSVFTADPSADLAAAGSFRSSGGLIGNTIALARANGRYNGDASKDGLLALWYNGSGLNTTGDGSVLTVTLHPRSDAPAGTYTVEVGYSPADTCDQTGSEVALKTAQGTVTISAAQDPAPSGNAQKPAADGSQDTATDDSQKPAADGSQDTTAGDAEDPAADGAQRPAETDAADPSGTDPIGESAQVSFTDVSGHWAEDYITRAAQLGLVEGYNGQYLPDDDMSRAQLVTILWRASGSPAPAAPASFTDLDAGQTWYLDAVAWAEQSGVVNGVGGDRFDPDGPVSREQLVTILHRLAGTPSGMETMLTGAYDSQYPDSGTVSDWAKAALYWSIYSDIYCGQTSPAVGQTLAPAVAADRAQIAVMMVRYLDRE